LLPALSGNFLIYQIRSRLSSALLNLFIIAFQRLTFQNSLAYRLHETDAFNCYRFQLGFASARNYETTFFASLCQAPFKLFQFINIELDRLAMCAK
jgi:hypothetical protein